MQERKRVVLYGDSVVLAGVGQSLQRYPALQVLSLDAPSLDAPRELAALQPAAVILDLSVVSTSSAISLLDDCPELLLIGLEPEGERLVVLSRVWPRALATEDLVRLIETGALGPAAARGEPEEDEAPGFPAPSLG